MSQTDTKSTTANSNLGLSAYFKYHGGPVIKSPSVGIVIAGSRPDANFTINFVKELLTSDFMNVLAQYGVGKGTVAGTISVTTLPQIGRSEIVTIAKNAKRALPTSNTLLILLGNGISYSDGSTNLCTSNANAFGFHDYTYSGFQLVPYAVVPYLCDACLKDACSSDIGCSLHLAETVNERITQVISHEFAEMFTSPRLDGWNAGNSGNENGDICNGQGMPFLGTKVQAIYSKQNDACMVSAPAPIPPAPSGEGFLDVIFEHIDGFFTAISGIIASFFNL